MANDNRKGARAPGGAFAGLTRPQQVAKLVAQLDQVRETDQATAFMRKAIGAFTKSPAMKRFKRPRDATFVLMVDVLLGYAIGVERPLVANQMLVAADDAGVKREDIIAAMKRAGIKGGADARKNLRTRLTDTRKRDRQADAAREALERGTADPPIDLTFFRQAHALQEILAQRARAAEPPA